MKKLLMASVAFASLISGSAMAADMPVKAVYKAPPVYVYSWTGCFVGGNVGGVWINKDWTSALAIRRSASRASRRGQAFGSHDANSWLGGFQAGCDYQFAGGWVVGLQGDYDWTRASGNSVDAINNRFFGVTCTRSLVHRTRWLPLPAGSAMPGIASLVTCRAATLGSVTITSYHQPDEPRLATCERNPRWLDASVSAASMPSPT